MTRAELVKLRRNDAVTDTYRIAEGTGNQHLSVMRILKKYQEDFGTLGRLEFMDLKSINPKGGRPERFCFLNEPQAMLLITYLDNTPIVRAFKMELVRQFCDMRKIIAERAMPEWKECRRRVIETRNTVTDTQKRLVSYAAAQGSKHPDRLYQVYAKLANDTAGISSRETATLPELAELNIIERAIDRTVAAGMKQGLYYKDIYRECKNRVSVFAAQ